MNGVGALAVSALRPAALLLGAALAVTSCGGGHPGTPSHPAPTTGAQGAHGTVTAPPPGPTGQATTAGPPATPTPAPTPTCVERTMTGMSEAQRVGQLFMVAVSTSGVSRTVTGTLDRADVGSVMLLGHTFAGSKHVKGLVDGLGRLTRTVSGARVGPLVSTDQEGGTVQTLNGPGFSHIPSAVAQGQWPVSKLQSQAAQWAGQLRDSGLNMNLAPIADVVPPGTSATNAPIGALSREYGHDPTTVAEHSTAFLKGMTQSGVLGTLKHFPGLGRVRGNTDVTANVTDSVTTRNDPFLEPFRSGIQAGAPFVMASSAYYSRIDPSHQAAFSSAILRGMLRGDLGFTGVIISDDLGHAVAVRSTPVGQRAVEFLSAGGNMVLTVDPATVPAMTSAVLGRLASDAAFRSAVDDSVRHILIAKEKAGVLTCGG
jgi:beta-N-acetylhexosaminidase